MVPHVLLYIGHCPPLDPLSFGQLLFEGSTMLPVSAPNQVIDYRCAQGYRFVNSTDNAVLSANSTRCLESGEWSLLGVACMGKIPPMFGKCVTVRTMSLLRVGYGSCIV